MRYVEVVGWIRYVKVVEWMRYVGVVDCGVIRGGLMDALSRGG